jgi:formylglycine-generating enzyme required for sulfatase activity
MRAFFLSLLCGLGALHAAVPVASSISAAQQTNSRLVDVASDVAADFPADTVSLRDSSNGRSIFTAPVTTFSGAIGTGVTTGAAKKITWDSGVDWGGQYSTEMRFKVKANDGNSVPTNMAFIPQGAFTMGDSLDELSEAPIRIVVLDAFYMGKCEVTKAEWGEVRTWGLNNGRLRKGQQPPSAVDCLVSDGEVVQCP